MMLGNSGFGKCVIAGVTGILFLGVFTLLEREKLLGMAGDYLMVCEKPERSDVIVVLRGDRNYCRVLESARLLKEGYSDRIYISKELVDKCSTRLGEHGIELPPEQSRLRSVLVQLGVPDEKVLMGEREPGGGTEGEANRTRHMMLRHGFKRALVVTNWWHTRRTDTIYRTVFHGTKIRVKVVAARNDMSRPSDWWKYRYEAIRVIEEFPKLFIHHVSPIFNYTFNDDPANQEMCAPGE